MNDFQLRPVTPDDAPFLHLLMNQPALMERLHQPATSLSDWQEAVLLWLSDPDERGYIITVQSQPIGWFAVNGLRSVTPYIKMAALLPSWQGQGIGRRVILQLCDDLRREGYSSVRLYTDQDNRRALSCYDHAGFRILAGVEELWPDGSLLQRYELEKLL